MLSIALNGKKTVVYKCRHEGVGVIEAATYDVYTAEHTKKRNSTERSLQA